VEKYAGLVEPDPAITMVPMDSESTAAPDLISDRSGYWEQYYGTSRVPPSIPSQFAVFVASELNGQYRVVDLGCGTGRDALYFSQLGHTVVGVDGSDVAIHGCQAASARQGLTAQFVHSSISEPGLASAIPQSDLPTAVYARFFLHALTDAEEQAFLKLAAALTAPGDLLATEYRTVRDSSGVKVTGAHYRRFIKPASFQANASAFGFDADYTVEGYGHAKYGADDAYVARELFVRR
jgi:SAM-dependent methyltransferase